MDTKAFEHFERIRQMLCASREGVTIGKMMSAPAIHYQKKVFAFFSKQNKMVFKLGKDYSKDKLGFEIVEFSPFKNKRPLSGWYEVGYEHRNKWEMLTFEALDLIKTRTKT